MKLDKEILNIIPIFDVFVCNDTVIDEELFQLWIEGYDVNAAAKVLMSEKDPKDSFPDEETVMSDVEDHYRTFAMLEAVLHSPRRLGDQIKFQIRPETQSYLIRKYYDLDDAVIREMLGKKFSSRTRKDLDEVSVKSGIPLSSCRRQFDNVKLVYKTVEEMTGCVRDNIEAEFLLPEFLSRRYAAVVFMTFNRFETGKKRLASVGFERFAACAKAIMDTWTDLDMDAEFFLDLRDLKTLQDKEKDLRSVTCDQVSAKWSAKPGTSSKSGFRNECEAVFKTFSRGVISIATGLHRSKEVRDFFLTLMEKVVEPLKNLKWTEEQVNCFVSSYMEAGSKLDALKKGAPGLSAVWDRYMNTMRICILEMYSA